VRALAGLAVAAAALAFGGIGAVAGASTSSQTVKLTVTVSGDGYVNSKPDGISCPSSCALRVKRGGRVTLTATPGSGSAFSAWSAPCGAAPTCKVTMSKARVVHATFEEQAITAPPPSPSAKDGHYVGTYTDGTYINFDVQLQQARNFHFDLNGSCDNGGTSYGTFHVSGPFPIKSDGSLTGSTSFTFDNGSATVAVAGTFTPSGAASGTLRISLAFTNGANCTSSGTWTAQDQS
jgi:hypothetical protein